MSNSRFTFVIPVYNGMPYIKDCIESIFAQSYKNYNICVLENNSSDGTYEYLKELNNPLINIIRSEETLSIEENWARILNCPKSEFMVFACSDDTFYPYFLDTVVDLIEKYPDASLYRTRFTVIDEFNRITGVSNDPPEIMTAYDMLKGLLRQTYSSTVAGYITRSNDYEKVGGIDCVNKLAYSDDILFNKLASISYLATSPLYACSYRRHSKTTSSNTDDNTLKNAFIHYFEYIKSLNNPKMNKIVKRYIYRYLDRVKVSYNEENFNEIKKTAELFNLKPYGTKAIYHKIKKLLNKKYR